MTGLLRERHIAPSILSADFAALGRDIEIVITAGARIVHVDVMDGRFVPNITIGLPVVAALADRIHELGAIVDCHLMIVEPERYAERFVEAGADVVTVHQEACTHLHRTLSAIRDLGAAAGVALNPATPVETLSEVGESCDLVLVMSVNPGFGGQSFIAGSLDKVRRARAAFDDGVAIEVDGGVATGNVTQLVEAGANILVAGSSVFGTDPASRFAGLQDQLRE
jgi:ribulose-phosphate 3-epimerase